MLFERFLFARSYARKAQEGRRRWRPEMGRFADVRASLDTPWRVAAFMEGELREEGPMRAFQVPRPAEVTWQRACGHAGDYARFAQEILHHHGYETRYILLLRSRPLRGHVVCAVRDPNSQGWFHLSTHGLFGLYAELDELFEDVQPMWELVSERDVELNLVRLERRLNATKRR